MLTLIACDASYLGKVCFKVVKHKHAGKKGNYCAPQPTCSVCISWQQELWYFLGPNFSKLSIANTQRCIVCAHSSYVSFTESHVCTALAALGRMQWQPWDTFEGTFFGWSVYPLWQLCPQDFLIMFLHHVATISLITFSYVNNMARVGTLVMCLHDAADVLIEVRMWEN